MTRGEGGGRPKSSKDRGAVATICVYLTAEQRDKLDKAAVRDFRTRSTQALFYIMEGMKRDEAN